MKHFFPVFVLFLAMAAVSPAAYAGADPSILQATNLLNDVDWNSDGTITEDEAYYQFDDGNYQWEHPEILIFKDGSDVTGTELVQGCHYIVKSTVYNNGDAAASGVKVTMGIAGTGTGQEYTELGQQTIDLEAGASKQLEYPWHATTSGHQCLQVNVEFDGDADDTNNYGQRNTNTLESLPGATISRKMLILNHLRVKPSKGGKPIVTDTTAFAMKAFVRLDKANDTATNRDRVKVSLQPRMFVLKGKAGQMVDVKITLDKSLPQGADVLVTVRAIAANLGGRILDGVTYRLKVLAGTSTETGTTETGTTETGTTEGTTEGTTDTGTTEGTTETGTTDDSDTSEETGDADDWGLADEGTTEVTEGETTTEETGTAVDSASGTAGVTGNGPKKPVPPRMKKENVEKRIQEFADKNGYTVERDSNGVLQVKDSQGNPVECPLPVVSGLSQDQISNRIKGFAKRNNLTVEQGEDGKPVLKDASGNEVKAPIKRIIGLPRPPKPASATTEATPTQETE